MTAADAEFDFLAPRHDVPTGGRSGFTLVDGRQVHYLEWGASSARPVVCLHGGGQTAYMWEELGATLARTHHVLAPDMLGFGGTDKVVYVDRAQYQPRMRQMKWFLEALKIVEKRQSNRASSHAPRSTAAETKRLVDAH